MSKKKCWFLKLFESTPFFIRKGNHSHYSDLVILGVSSVLTVQSSNHAHTVDNAVISDFNLTIQDGSHSHLSDNIVVQETNLLVVQDSSHGLTSDNINLTYEYSLSVQESLHSHSAENSVISTGNQIDVIYDGLHIHESENINLNSSHIVTIQESHHLHTANQISLNIESGVFPGAKGFGANWTFTSNYEVRIVTNLNNSGTGSLRTAVTTSTTYDGVIVVFNGLSGIINLDSSLVINIGNKHLYIAGQTSENGIFVKNSGSFSSAYLFSLQNDYTIIRGIGIGNNYSGTTDTCHVYNSQNVVFDRSTILWGTDETFDVFGNWVAATNPANSRSEKTTVQNCLIGEPLNPSHRLNTLVYATDELSFYQNLFVHSAGRVPLLEADGLKIEVVRNMGYNNQIGQTHFKSYANTAEHSDVHHSVINNYEKTGSDSLGGVANSIRVMIELDSQTTTPTINVYAKGNINPSRTSSGQDEYDAIRTYGGSSPYTFPEAQKISEATWNTIKSGYPLADEPIITHTELETLLTGSNGVGTFTRNDVETRILNEVVNSTGSFTNTGVAPTIPAGSIISDSDNDGIPDSLEGIWGDDTFGYVNSLVTGETPPEVINVTSVTVSPSSDTISEGNTTQLSASFTPVDATDQTGIWSSNNDSIATVTQNGLVEGVAQGSATITFTSTDGGFTDTSNITVTVVSNVFEADVFEADIYN